MKTSETKIINLVVLFCACVLIMYGIFMFMPVRGEHRVFNDMLRLHILANSDSDYDQSLKLEVRDYIVADIAELTRDSACSDEAADKINAALDNIEQRTRDFMQARGHNYKISASLSRGLYPRRIYTDGYADFMFPAGEYNSLRIIIGEARGENWWCVLFPPLCLSGVIIEEELTAAGYTSGQINILKTDSGTRYEIRFKFLEIFNRLFR